MGAHRLWTWDSSIRADAWRQLRGQRILVDDRNRVVLQRHFEHAAVPGAGVEARDLSCQKVDADRAPDRQLSELEFNRVALPVYRLQRRGVPEQEMGEAAGRSQPEGRDVRFTLAWYFALEPRFYRRLHGERRIACR